MNGIRLLRVKNKVIGAFWPAKVARDNAKLFLTPRKRPLKDWELEVEKKGERVRFGGDLSALCWGHGERNILIMHGWESRATQMYALAEPLVRHGFRVIAIDAPLHGHSGGKKSNPVAFAEAIVAAEQALGPFAGAIGHSMGGAALAIAKDLGANPGRCVFIATPHCVHGVLTAFCHFMGLSPRSTEKFIACVESEVGRPAKELNVGDLMAGHPTAPLLVHSLDDREIPYRCMKMIQQAIPHAQTWSPKDLGHRKVVRDARVASIVRDYLAAETPVTLSAQG